MAIWQALIRVQPVLVLAVCLIGCAPLPSKTIQTMIPEESLSFLEIEKTTKDEVRETLGKPWQSDEVDNKWLYKLRTVATGRFGFCLPFSEVDCESTDGKAVLYVLEIYFDDADVVTGWEEFNLK